MQCFAHRPMQFRRQLKTPMSLISSMTAGLVVEACRPSRCLRDTVNTAPSLHCVPGSFLEWQPTCNAAARAHWLPLAAQHIFMSAGAGDICRVYFSTSKLVNSSPDDVNKLVARERAIVLHVKQGEDDVHLRQSDCFCPGFTLQRDWLVWRTQQQRRHAAHSIQSPQTP